MEFKLGDRVKLVNFENMKPKYDIFKNQIGKIIAIEFDGALVIDWERESLFSCEGYNAKFKSERFDFVENCSSIKGECCRDKSNHKHYKYLNFEFDVCTVCKTEIK